MKLFIILFCIVIQWMFKIVVGEDFKVQVLPTDYSWNVKVTSSCYFNVDENEKSNYGAFEESMLAMAEKIDDNAKITKEMETQIINVYSVAKIPEEFKKYFASISGFNEKIELSREHVHHSPTIVKFQLPSLERRIKNPILQNGNGLGFTYTFDFGEKQDMSINLNFVQLVNPNNFHNESTSSHVPEYSFQTPEHPTNVSTNFHHLNLRDEDDVSEGETERPNYAAMAEGQGVQLNFDEASTSSGSSGKKSSRRPPKPVSPPTNHEKAQQISMQKRPQRKLTTTRSMPVERGSSHDLNDSGHSSNNTGHANNDVAAMHHAGGMGQFQGYGHQSTESQQWPPSEYPPAYYGYNQSMFGHLSFNNANMHGNFGGQKTFNRSESLPVDHQNGGGYTGSYPYSPSPSSYWTDTSSDYSSSQTSLSGPGSDSMNLRENVIHETHPVYHQFDSYSGSHSYGGNIGGHNGGQSWICGTTPILYHPYDESHYDGTNGGNLPSMHPTHIGGGTPSIFPMPDHNGNIVYNHDYDNDLW
uniref:Uncharacterized protein n=1 Tax=Meloidogyne javanica TaxID=6303 RepID=A0A915MCK8_MELJA